MNKYLKDLVVALFLLIVYAIAFAPSAYALGESMDLTVTTVIDNAAEYPMECAGLSSKYSAVRIYKMEYSSTYANYPIASSSKVFDIVNNQTTTIHYNNYSSAMCDSFWFESNAYTDQHLSLSSMEYTDEDNLRSYTYSPTGNPSNPYSAKPFNWAEVIDSSKGSAGVTLHFRYNPDIESVDQPDPDPEPDYSKKIDYLGDGVPNSDTTADGKNDYRLYLDAATQPAAADNKADIVFVLDVSGSMAYDLESGQSKISVLKSTMINAIDNLTQNQYNRISIIQFASNSKVLISNSKNRNQLVSCIQGLSAAGGTNYYASLLDAASEIKAGGDSGAEKVVIFVTDGEPTFAAPAAVTQSNNTYAGMIYACQAVRQVSNVDRFYSIFVGDNKGSASSLQTITQMVNVGKEKYMVQASSTEQVSNTFKRFMSKMSNSLYNVTISDELSQYVSYTGGLKVTRSTGQGEPVDLTAGIDYTINAGMNNLSIQLLQSTTPDSRYTVSFNVQSSEEALDYYDLNQSFPNVGDAETDYPGNATSSGQPGFYSNAVALLNYSFGGSGTAQKIYVKPVVQAVEPEPVPAEINVRKILTGKDLIADMFTFELAEVTEEGDIIVGTATNDADGFVTFDSLSLSKPGSYTYKIKEVIPAVRQPGMVYDTKTIQVTVDVTRSNDDLVAEVKYPSEAIFLNSYKPVPVSVTLKANKELTGRTLTAGMFQFRLLENSGASVETVHNTAAGKIQFSPLTFTKDGVYTYAIRESVPIPANPNIIYDMKIITAKITVEDQDGVLSANVQYSSDTTFYNEFSYSSSDATIKLKKVLTGMQLTAGMFKFELTDQDTGSTKTASNQADGTISFNLSYSAPGTHTYTIREVKPQSLNKYMTYDTKAIEVTVQVIDDGSGGLATKVIYPADSNFYNSYKVRGGIW